MLERGIRTSLTLFLKYEIINKISRSWVTIETKIIFGKIKGKKVELITILGVNKKRRP